MEKEKLIAIFSQIGIVVILLIALFITVIIYMRYKRNEDIRQREDMQKDFEEALLRSQIEVQEQTFEQIGKNLHDNVGQLLSSAKMLLGLTEKKLGLVPESFHTATGAVSQAILELRFLSRALDKEWLQLFNFTENLKAEIDRINSGGSIEAIFTYRSSVELLPSEQIILFRIVQEAIQNAIKHANPTHIEIRLITEGGKILISIRDNGKGFTFTPINTMGVNNMKQRVKLLGGSIEWQSVADTGTTVTIVLPIKNEES